MFTTTPLFSSRCICLNYQTIDKATKIWYLTVLKDANYNFKLTEKQHYEFRLISKLLKNDLIEANARFTIDCYCNEIAEKLYQRGIYL